MNFKKDLSTKNQNLLKDIEYKVEDKEYTPEEIKDRKSVV